MGQYIYIKPTDGHQELHCNSCHLHIKISVPYCQKMSSTCSSEKNFKTHVSQIKRWVLGRCHREIVVNNQINKVVSGRDQSVKKNLQKGISFVTTCHKVKRLAKLIRDLLPFIFSVGEVKRFSHLL